ncbi:MAG: chorismate-binding protein [Cyclobacteriaceae bacterium]|nr:anthranilate synthase component I family protein [Cyclobacteriaceae bacterium]MCH8515999.1 chorismate-binding protein [Cyclobacteriaceae bacterium]
MSITLTELYDLSKSYPYFFLSFKNNVFDSYPIKTFQDRLLLSNGPALSLEAVKGHNDCFGGIAYDYKNSLNTKLSSNNSSFIDFPDCAFYNIDQSYRDNDLIHLKQALVNEAESSFKLSLDQMQSSETKASYLSKVKQIRQQIIDGDFYEMNFCMQFSKVLEEETFDPISFFFKLYQKSPAPFSCLLKQDHLWVICASPERYLCQHEGRWYSQPIKGTAARKEDIKQDRKAAKSLLTDEKERAENLMITDLVRNDLAQVGISGTTQVDELFGVYSFAQVHQMITTISTLPREGIDIEDLLKVSFPMGSMTGAPKFTVMEHIDQYENFKRNLYSGTIGYKERGLWDLNVVIRSVIFDQKENKLSFAVGSAITYDSIPEKEYDECLLKATTVLKALSI